MKLLRNIKNPFKRESDEAILKNPSYTNRMKYMLITLRKKRKIMYSELITSRIHKKDHMNQELFMAKLAKTLPNPKDLLEMNMRKEFLKDFPKYRKYIDKKTGLIVET